MKNLTMAVVSLLLIGVAVLALAVEKGHKGEFEAKAGDRIYVCGCGDGCSCGTLALKEGICGCGNKLTKTTVTKMAGGKVYYKLNGKELAASAQGKYFCSCEGCGCGTISQKPGKCGCGQNLVKVE